MQEIESATSLSEEEVIAALEERGMIPVTAEQVLIAVKGMGKFGDYDAKTVANLINKKALEKKKRPEKILTKIVKAERAAMRRAEMKNLFLKNYI